jgi:hypothetical protein
MTQDNGRVPEPQLACLFCGTTTAMVTAPDGGWVPSFWHDGKEYSKKGKGVCPDCTSTHLRFNVEYGDYELLSGHSLPETL